MIVFLTEKSIIMWREFMLPGTWMAEAWYLRKSSRPSSLWIPTAIPNLNPRGYPPINPSGNTTSSDPLLAASAINFSAFSANSSKIIFIYFDFFGLRRTHFIVGIQKLWYRYTSKEFINWTTYSFGSIVIDGGGLDDCSSNDGWWGIAVNLSCVFESRHFLLYQKKKKNSSVVFMLVTHRQLGGMQCFLYRLFCYLLPTDFILISSKLSLWFSFL